MKALLTKGLHYRVYFGDFTDESKLTFRFKFFITRDFDHYYLEKVDNYKERQLNLDASNELQEFDLPEVIWNKLESHIDSINAMFDSLTSLKDHNLFDNKVDRMILRKEDYIILHRSNDYASIKHYYTIIDNILGISIGLSSSNSGKKVNFSNNCEGRYISLNEKQFYNVFPDGYHKIIAEYIHLNRIVIELVKYTFGTNDNWYNLQPTKLGES